MAGEKILAPKRVEVALWLPSLIGAQRRRAGFAGGGTLWSFVLLNCKRAKEKGSHYVPNGSGWWSALCLFTFNSVGEQALCPEWNGLGLCFVVVYSITVGY